MSSERLDKLAEIFNSYKEDIARLSKEYFGEMKEHIEKFEKSEFRSNDFKSSYSEIDMRFRIVQNLTETLVRMDEVYKDLMIVEEMLKKFKGGEE